MSRRAGQGQQLGQQLGLDLGLDLPVTPRRVAGLEAPALTARQIARALDRDNPTDEQVRVIEAPLEPLLVVAGAGSGKTETMAARVVWMVANGLVSPDRVLGLTFTRKAAGELSERIRRRLTGLRARGVGAAVPAAAGGGLGEPLVSTYHSYAASVVADHGLRLGVEPRSRLLTEAGAWQLASDVVESWPGPMDQVDSALDTVVKAVLGLAGECAEHLVEPGAVVTFLDRLLAQAASLPADDGGGAPGRPTGEMATVLKRLGARRQVLPIVQAYAARKREHDLLDFGDQVALAARVAERVPQVGAQERERFTVVLLDEYQDTGHAQLRLLRRVFGDGHPVTAVGDPHQSIYGWRGAGAGNLERFPREFPRSPSSPASRSSRSRPGSPAAVAHLSTSWRNDVAVLEVANVIAGPLRDSAAAPGGPGVTVPPLAARPGAGPGDVRISFHLTVDEEATHLSRSLAQLWQRDADPAGAAHQGPRRSMAVLCRKRSQFPVLEQALREVGLPVEVVGLGGLLQAAEVVDVVATLQVLHDPTRGDSLLRLLTGARWRVGAQDLEVLATWAKVSAPRRAGPRRWEHAQAPAAEPMPDAVDERSIIDALDELPDDGWVPPGGRGFSAPGLARLTQARDLLRALRSRVSLDLPDLVLEVERSLMLDVELGARLGVSPGAARANLDALLDVAADFADGSGSPTLGGFLAWLDAAQEHERGLDPGEVETSVDAVQLLTVHAAKGLEHDVVAVPGLVEGTFPACDRAASPGNPDLASGWLSEPGALPYELRGDKAALPHWRWQSAASQRALKAEHRIFRAACGRHEMVEERRLAYVAATRARSVLLLSGAWWADQTTPRRPSRFLTELRESDLSPERLTVTGWEPEPGDGPNPRTLDSAHQRWPLDPLGPRRADVERAASWVRAAAGSSDAAAPQDAGLPGDAAGWAGEVTRLLAEREAVRPRSRVVLPSHLSASRLVRLAEDPTALAAEIRRPMPSRPQPHTRRGTAFHAWLEQRFAAGALLDVEELPGSADQAALPDDELPRLQQAFLASEWGPRRPLAVEVEVGTVVAGSVVRGRVDAVFRRADGGVDIVDWKTGPEPTGAAARARAVQLAVYRLAWSRMHDLPVEEVGAAFFYAATGHTVRPVDLSGERDLERLLSAVPVDDGQP